MIQNLDIVFCDECNPEHSFTKLFIALAPLDAAGDPNTDYGPLIAKEGWDQREYGDICPRCIAKEVGEQEAGVESGAIDGDSGAVAQLAIMNTREPLEIKKRLIERLQEPGFNLNATIQRAEAAGVEAIKAVGAKHGTTHPLVMPYDPESPEGHAFLKEAGDAYKAARETVLKG